MAAWTQEAAKGGGFSLLLKGEKSMLMDYTGVVNSHWRCVPVNLDNSYHGEK